MKELALHILDIMENSIRANASKISVSLVEDNRLNQFILTIQDNGKGMDKEVLARVRDPFFTGQNKKVGMGIPLLEQLASMCVENLILFPSLEKGQQYKLPFKGITLIFRLSAISLKRLWYSLPLIQKLKSNMNMSGIIAVGLLIPKECLKS